MKTNTKLFSGGGTYISAAAIARLTLKKHIQMIIGGFFTAVFLFGIISGVTGYNEKLRDNLITNIVMLVPSALLLLNGIKNGIRRVLHVVTIQYLCATKTAPLRLRRFQSRSENRPIRRFPSLNGFSERVSFEIVHCKSRDCHVCFSRAERTAKQALSTLYAKNVTEQQESAPEALANASIAEMQSQVAIPDKCKTQKKGDVKLYRKILTQKKKSKVRIMLLFNPTYSGKFYLRTLKI